MARFENVNGRGGVVERGGASSARPAAVTLPVNSTPHHWHCVPVCAVSHELAHVMWPRPFGVVWIFPPQLGQIALKLLSPMTALCAHLATNAIPAGN